MLVSAGAAWTLILFVAAWIGRWIAAGLIDAALAPMVGRPALSTPFWMLPLRDLLSVAEIATSFGVDEVVWRGHKLGTNSDPRPVPAKKGTSA